ncbi:MAG TPA: hypothetical protein VN719_09630 [Gemmatimonadales bacterium]|nr:hypothetical protein [Gemmatimonadales bacterium]
MTANVSGGFTLSSNLVFAIPAGANVLTAYNVPIQPNANYSYTPGTGANQMNKGYQASGNAAAAPVSIDLTTVVCVDGSTGLAHVRELLIFNDDPTHTLNWDMTIVNSLLGPFTVATKWTIPPLSHARIANPASAAGWTVDSTHKIVDLDPGANTIAYRLVAGGD